MDIRHLAVAPSYSFQFFSSLESTAAYSVNCLSVSLIKEELWMAYTNQSYNESR